ncbi:nucleotidyltransferase family protein [Fluoribacter dumoffii]|uniref:Glucose-1-phosphate thymidylyltransferase 1 n=1 Tax=Fluoribacter dumoffii TaxID=463 RepID=A0A377GD45_9GAMM|nr:nucleotidyltransferase family protein [Fluoribacter dumoffii]KTC91050.1 nucleotidyltransferase [Fluoribacter dumoffii NY 23]MCW8416661.1 nucleotidyltransferase family protein [Fluoribacter dumoffii]MCW8455499.1 nucleotidyltransferase family protein [Fluoribacter dumoffii]MCW8460422.1 nucleotidyltransferase family protein [Fluoribacter dumoffii]MCW8483902.1 nucleotidyltransferase family protein [Fluoribacter dumoffii]
MKTAMILAAGRGDRLKPITERMPKALCIVKERPLIEHHVINLVKAGFQRVVINHAYLGGQIRQHLGNGSRWGIDICYSPEPPGGLETGGGIVNALPLLGVNPFITVNADIYTDFDFSQLQPENTASIHVILVNKNPALNHHGDFGLINQIQLSNNNPEYTLAGICCYNPKIFTDCRQGRYSIAPLIRHYAAQNKATASVYNGLWYDIGTLERLQAVNQI